ncbi:MAG TPA: hypothetical protein VGE52_05715 [Pirellulales bacterium]
MKASRYGWAAALAVAAATSFGCAQGSVPPPEPTSPPSQPVPTGDPASMESHPPSVNTPREPNAGAAESPHSN